MKSFQDNLIFGRIGENTVAKLLQRHGYSIESNRDGQVKNGRGPAMETQQGNISQPDFTISRQGVSLAAEIKTKSARTFGIKTQQWETGIDHDKWSMYRDYQRETGKQVLLFIVEYFGGLAPCVQYIQRSGLGERHDICALPDFILVQWVGVLKKSLTELTDCYDKTMVYFSVNQFVSGPGSHVCAWLALLENYIQTNASLII
jgi:hypothetical protein